MQMVDVVAHLSFSFPSSQHSQIRESFSWQLEGIGMVHILSILYHLMLMTYLKEVMLMLES
jgi:hypothetical protein